MVRKLFKIHITVAIVSIAYIFVLTYYKIYCPIKYFFNITCPTCGVTRAMLSLFKGDFSGYMHYNPMAIFLLLSVLLILHRELFKDKVKKAITVISIFIASVNAVYWCVKVIG